MRRFLLQFVATVALIGIGMVLGVLGERHLNKPPEPVSQLSATASLLPCPDEYVLKRFQQLWYIRTETWKENRWLGIS